MTRASVILWMAAAGSMAPQIAHAQGRAAFEVSPSIQLKGRTAAASRTPNRLALQSMPAGSIVAFAYGLPLDRVERRPQWMYDGAYDVSVTTTAPATLPEQKLMLQRLLQERFGLMVHRISYASPVYHLVAGPNVHLTPAQEPGAAGLPEFVGRRGLPPTRATVEGLHVSMSDLADWLYGRLQLPVLDKTGMTGLFDIEITGMPINNSGDAIISAVQNSLGLLVERRQGTAESLIIDSSTKPN